MEHQIQPLCVCVCALTQGINYSQDDAYRRLCNCYLYYYTYNDVTALSGTAHTVMFYIRDSTYAREMLNSLRLLMQTTTNAGACEYNNSAAERTVTQKHQHTVETSIT